MTTPLTETAATETPATDSFWKELEASLGLASEARPLNVLFATDGSEASLDAARFLACLPLPAGSWVELIYALDPATAGISPTLAMDEANWARHSLDQVEALLGQREVEVARRTPQGPAPREILHEAREADADLLVLGSHGRTGLAAFALGSVARNVARHADRPVLVARAPRSRRLQHLVVALDGSEHSVQALRFLLRLPLPADTRITVCHVVRPYVPLLALGPEYAAGLDESVAEINRQRAAAGKRLLQQATDTLRSAGREVTPLLLEGDPAAEILRVATEQEADLIAAGARGVSGLEGLTVGSVADRLLSGARCSLLLAH